MGGKYGRYGRYGTDELNKFIMVLTVILVVLNLFLNMRAIHILIILLLILGFCRAWSKCFDNRRRENMKYLEIKNRFFGNKQQRAYNKEKRADRKAANEGKRVLICPYCKEKLRVPVGAGKIKINCPHCNREFEETV